MRAAAPAIGVDLAAASPRAGDSREPRARGAAIFRGGGRIQTAGDRIRGTRETWGMSASNPPPKIACPHCQALIKSPALPAGSAVNCPKCGKAFRIGQEPGGAERGNREQGTEGRGQGSAAKRPDARSQPSHPMSPAAAKPKATTLPTPQAPVAAATVATKPVIPRPAAVDPELIAKSLEQSGRTGVAAVIKEDLVDPNLLAPAPPPKQAKQTQVVVVCMLCGTRLYAPLTKVGQTIQCPDCHRVNEILPPRCLLYTSPSPRDS